MPGQPNRRTPHKVSKSRRAFYASRDQALRLAVALDKVQPGAGDAYLDQLTVNLNHCRDQALSAFQLSADPAA
jgi:hypothetical protein